MVWQKTENKDKPQQPSEKPKKGIKKKIRGSKKIKNTLRDFKIYYQNGSGLKSNPWNHFFCLYQKDKSSGSKVKFKEASNCC